MIDSLPSDTTALAPDSPVSSDGRAFLSDVARARRTHLLRLRLARGHALTFMQIRWIAERDPVLSARKPKTDLLALLDLGLVMRHAGPGRRADYALTPATRGSLKP